MLGTFHGLGGTIEMRNGRGDDINHIHYVYQLIYRSETFDAIFFFNFAHHGGIGIVEPYEFETFNFLNTFNVDLSQMACAQNTNL